MLFTVSWIKRGALLMVFVLIVSLVLTYVICHHLRSSGRYRLHCSSCARAREREREAALDERGLAKLLNGRTSANTSAGWGARSRPWWGKVCFTVEMQFREGERGPSHRCASCA
jgi:hypothetical protein